MASKVDPPDWVRICTGFSLRLIRGSRVPGKPGTQEDGEILDLSLPVAADLPCTWPADWFPLFQINHYRRIGPLSAYNSDILTIDGNTGTQIVELTTSGKREVRYDLIDHLADAKLAVQLDDSGKQRPFDDKGTDSTDARFQAAGPGMNVSEPVHRSIAAFTPRAKRTSGVTIAEFSVRPMTTTNR